MESAFAFKVGDLIDYDYPTIPNISGIPNILGIIIKISYSNRKYEPLKIQILDDECELTWINSCCFNRLRKIS